MISRRLLNVLAALAGFCLPPIGSAAPGDLDTAFGSGGKVVTPIGGNGDAGQSVAIQSDGKIVVAGNSNADFALVRYTSTGALDTSFGTGGKVITPVGSGEDGGTSVALQGDGKIVVAGYAENGSNADFALVRYTSTGALDMSFGTGGVVTTPIGSSNEQALSVKVQSNGKIVAAGFTWNGNNYDFALVRYTSAGALDSSFGSGGIVTTVSTGHDFAYSMAMQGDGAIVVVGWSVPGSNADFTVVRYTSTGALDPSFGSGGKVTTPVGSADDIAGTVALQSDGKIVVAGWFYNGSNFDIALVRYTDTGTLDTSFGSAGKVTTPIGSRDDYGHSVAIQSNGKIIVAGYLLNASSLGDIALVRYTSSGTLDASFGSGGIVTTSIGSDTDIARGVAVQNDGMIVVAGESWNGTNYDFALVRYEGDDTTTVPPTLTAPASFTATKSPISVNFTLPEAALAGSVKLAFGATVLTLAAAQESAGQHTFTFDPANPVGTSGGAIASGASVADGTYTVTLSYQDALGNPEASAASTNVTIDTVTPLPTLSTVGSVQYQGRTMSVNFTLPEAALAGSVKLTFDNGMTQTTFTLGPAFETQGAHSLTFDPDAPNASGHFTSATALADGTYTVTLSYQDALGNSAATSAGVMNVGVSSAPPPASVDSLVADAVGGIVIGSAQQPDGKTILLGTFTTVNGVTRNNVARVNADGSLDMTFDPNPNGRVNAVAVLPNGKIVLGGFFTTVQGVARSYLARLNADGTLDASFDAQVDSFVYGLAAQTNGKLLMWGVFHSVLGTTRNYVARLNADGMLDMGFDPNPNDYVFGAAVQGDGKVLLGGGFTSLDPNAASAPVARRYFARVNDNGSVDMGFDPSPNVRVFSTRQQPDGKVLLSGDFDFLEPNGGPSVTRHRIARVNANGTLDTGFNPDAPDFETNSVALQADGKVLFTGGFVTVQGTTRRYVARVGADGTLDADFDPNPDNFALSVTLQDDGKVQVGGGFTSLQPNGAASPTPRVNFARLVNDPATQTLTAPDATQVLWQRGGSATEVTGVTFEKSNDGGATWTPATAGTRVGTTANWQLTGLNLAGQVGKLRARGFTAGGYFNGSSGLIEQTSDFNFTPGITATPTLTAPATDSATKSPVTVTFTLPEAALSGSVKIKFGANAQTLVLAASQETAGEHTFTFDPANPVATSGGAVASIASGSITDATYEVTLSYQDAAGNAAATAVNTGVKIDTVTQSGAGLGFPQSGGSIGGPLGSPWSALSINLPEAATGGSVVFTFDDGTTQRVLTTTAAVAASGSNLIYLRPADPVGTAYLAFPGSGNPAAFASMTNGPAIPDGGPYSISFTYQDAVGNTAVQSNVATNVMVDTVTQAPTLVKPVQNDIDNAAFDVNFTLPEAAFADTVVLKFIGTSTVTLQLTTAHETQGSHSFQFDPRDPLAATDHIANGSAIPDGTYTVEISYRDATFNTAATASKTGVRVDTTPPTFAANPSFSPTIVYAGTALANYESQAGANDENGLFVGGLGSQSPAPGTVLTAGTLRVNFNVLDNAGNPASTGFDLVVRPLTPPHDVKLVQGAAAPGAGTNGLPGDAIIASFNTPATDDDGDLAFVAKWTSNGGRTKGTGLFLNSSCLAIAGGDASAVGGAGATWKSFTDPVVEAGRVACIATLAGVAKSASTAIVCNLTGAALEKIARAGEEASLAPGPLPGEGPKFKTFKAVTIAGGKLAYLAQLAAGSGNPKVTAANDMGVWFQEPNNGFVALREGQAVGGTTIKTLVAFLSGSGSPGCGRGIFILPNDGGDPQVCALAQLADKTQALVFQDVDDVPASSIISLSGDAATGLNVGATFASYSTPARNQAETTVFLGKLTLGGGVTKADASGIFTGPDMNGQFRTVVRTGINAGQAGSGATFSVLKDPVLSESGALAFPATVKGGTVKGFAATTLWWKPAGGVLTLLAQGGAEPADLPGAQWKTFPSLAIAANRGPVFSATLVSGKGGVTAKNASGVWACDFLGAPRLLFRTGDTDIVANKTLKSFTLLKATKGSTGVTRSFNAMQQVVWLATFTDKSQAIVTTEVP